MVKFKILKTISWKYYLIVSLSLILIYLSLFPIFITLDSWSFTPPYYSSDGELTNDILSSLDISQNGDYIVAYGRNIYYFSKTNPAPIWTYYSVDYGEPVTTIAMSSNGKSFVTGLRNGYLLYFEGSSSNPLWEYKTRTRIKDIDISEDGFYITAVSEDNLLFFNKSSSIPIWDYYLFGQDFVEISSNGSYIVTGGENILRIFSQLTPNPIWNYTFASIITDISVNKNGKVIIVGCEDGTLYLFENLVLTPVWSYFSSASITDVDISSTGQYVVACNNNNNLILLSNSSSLPLWIYHFSYNWELGIPQVSISGDGNYIIFDKDKYLILFHHSNNVPIWMDEHGELSWNFGEGIPFISYNGDYFAAILDGTLYLYYRLNPLMLLEFNNYYFWLFSIGYPSFSIFSILVIYRHRKSKKRRKILETMINSSEKIRLEMLMDLLEMNEKMFYKKFPDLAREFGLKIDNDYLILDKEKIQEFIDNLLNKFKEWERKSKLD